MSDTSPVEASKKNEQVLPSLFLCPRCDHAWQGRAHSRPKRCAGCKAHYWWKPARIKGANKKKGRGRGGPRKYPIHDLEVGESVLMAFHKLGSGMPDMKRNTSMNCAVLNYGRRSGKKFERKIEGAAGLRVTRTA